VKLSEHLHRAGVASSRTRADAAAVNAINRVIAIKSEIAGRGIDPPD
jgi:hypothetical protein